MKILDLARNIITLAGFQLDEDIEIRITGPRPGEKLIEELSFKDENTLATGHSN
ncbi:MAG: polysaccharide biosynthesis protein [Bryobacteraceae bacterium]